eukprot:5489424-Prymnesium_polylepis.1
MHHVVVAPPPKAVAEVERPQMEARLQSPIAEAAPLEAVNAAAPVHGAMSRRQLRMDAASETAANSQIAAP